MKNMLKLLAFFTFVAVAYGDDPMCIYNSPYATWDFTKIAKFYGNFGGSYYTAGLCNPPNPECNDPNSIMCRDGFSIGYRIAIRVLDDSDANKLVIYVAGYDGRYSNITITYNKDFVGARFVNAFQLNTPLHYLVYLEVGTSVYTKHPFGCVYQTPFAIWKLAYIKNLAASFGGDLYTADFCDANNLPVCNDHNSFMCRNGVSIGDRYAIFNTSISYGPTSLVIQSNLYNGMKSTTVIKYNNTINGGQFISAYAETPGSNSYIIFLDAGTDVYTPLRSPTQPFSCQYQDQSNGRVWDFTSVSTQFSKKYNRNEHYQVNLCGWTSNQYCTNANTMICYSDDYRSKYTPIAYRPGTNISVVDIDTLRLSSIGLAGIRSDIIVSYDPTVITPTITFADQVQNNYYQVKITVGNSAVTNIG